MLDTELKKPGTLLMHRGTVYFSGFHADNCMCREVAIHAMLWAIGVLQKEVIACINQPGGTSNTCADLPEEVYQALGIDPWTGEEYTKDQLAWIELDKTMKEVNELNWK